MLILGRKVEEQVRITTKSGEVIWLKVLSINKGRVRIGFNAPEEIVIIRKELIKDETNDNNS